jgi:hypothetical protein
MGRSMGWRPWEKTLLVLIWLAPLATRAAALPLGLNLMPIPAAILIGLVWTTWAPPKVGAPLD